jgi:hypothetical protein
MDIFVSSMRAVIGGIIMKTGIGGSCDISYWLGKKEAK